MIGIRNTQQRLVVLNRLIIAQPAGRRVGLFDDRGVEEPLHGLVLRGPPHDQVRTGPGRQARADCLRQLLRRPHLHVRRKRAKTCLSTWDAQIISLRLIGECYSLHSVLCWSHARLGSVAVGRSFCRGEESSWEPKAAAACVAPYLPGLV